MNRESIIPTGFPLSNRAKLNQKKRHIVGSILLGFAGLAAVAQLAGGSKCHAQQSLRAPKSYIPVESQPTRAAQPAASGLTPTTSVLTVSGSDPYSMTCNVSGAAIAGTSGPSGTVNFTDATTGQALGSAALQSNGTGPAYSTSWTGPVSGYFIGTGDFNGDGIPDLAFGDGSTLQIWLGTGGGNFKAGQQISSGSGQFLGIAVADFNKDGKLDLAVDFIQSGGQMGVASTAISVLLGNGDGTFQSPVQLATTNSGRWNEGARIGIVATDLNNDGIPDIAAVDPADNTVMVFLGIGDGTFHPVQQYTVGNTPWGLATADFNKDGKPDLIASNYEGNSISVLLGNGDGTFKPQVVTSDTGLVPDSVFIGDFNRDGLPDALVSGSVMLGQSDWTSGAVLFLGNGDGTFQTVNLDPLVYPGAVGDMNGDGILDIISSGVTADPITGAVTSTFTDIYLGKGDGTFQAGTRATTTADLSLIVADLNGDGILDIVESGIESGTNTVADESEVFLGFQGAFSQANIANAIVNVGTTSSHNLECSYPGDNNYASSTSNLITETYGQADTPQFSPLIGVYPPGLAVTVTDPQGGAVLYCTSDGSTPTTSSNACGSPITLNSTTTLKAMAAVVGYVQSAVSTATYTIQQTGGSYSLSAPALNVTQGGSGTATVTVSSTNTYVGTVSLTCSVTSGPSGAVDPPSCLPGKSVTLTSNTTSATSSLSIGTTAANSAAVSGMPEAGGTWKAKISLFAGCVLLLVMPRRRTWLRALQMMALLIAVIACVGACGSSSKSMVIVGTTPGTYQITITGTGSDTAKTPASTTFSLTVQ